MSNLALGVNPEILKWAREKAGYSIEEVARAFKKDLELVRRWESGEAIPTYNQLERLAYSLYKRPIGLFYFPSPPSEPDPKQAFRTLPAFEIDNLSRDTRYGLRQARAMQIALAELNDGVNPSSQRIFNAIVVPTGGGVQQVAKKVRLYLGLSIADQLGWKSKEDALEHWRNSVQDKGVFVFKRSYKQRDVSGFSLVDREFPVIYLNNSTTPSRQIFTLFHELGHILTNSSGVTKINDRYIASLSGNARQIEVFCNQFAAELLVPSEAFDRELGDFPTVEKTVKVLAGKYKVSREVILRKLLDRGLVSQSYYDKKTAEWNAEYQEFVQERKEKGNSGGDYYATQASYLGDRYLSLAFNKYYEGKLNREQLADYLSVKMKGVSELEDVFLTKA